VVTYPQVSVSVSPVIRLRNAVQSLALVCRDQLASLVDPKMYHRSGFRASGPVPRGRVRSPRHFELFAPAAM